MERIEIRPGYSISRVIKGGWHLAGGHGQIEEAQAIDDMLAFVEARITTFDCADIYTGVETLIGKFLKKHHDAFQSGNLPPVQVHTKYVPDLNALGSLTQADTTRIIDRSLQRLGVERLDLVQFAWWDYDFENYVDVALHLKALQDQGKIRHIGVTNFDGQRLGEIREAGVNVVANQVQYSVLDQRARREMESMAVEQNIPFLCYGVVAGGFLSDRYLGVPDPTPPFENRSLTKYRLIIDEFGNYEVFQAMLRCLRSIADNYEVGIAEVASRYVLQQSGVGGLIIGARNRRHLERLIKLDQFELDPEDIDRIEKLVAQSKGPQGPFYALEREKGGRHAAIMKYNLNEPGA